MQDDVLGTTKLLKKLRAAAIYFNYGTVRESRAHLTYMHRRSVTQKERHEFLPNMGPVSTIWLRTIGVETLEDLEKVGLEEAYKRLVGYGFNVNALMLYAMEGALTGKHWNAIGDSRKAELRQLAKQVRNARTL
jgi:DNA transformation protein and related proteins